MMKIRIILLLIGFGVLFGCQAHRPGTFKWAETVPAPTQQGEVIPTVNAAMLLPLSGKSAAIGDAFRNSAIMALQDQPSSPLKLLFFDTQGTAEGTKAAWEEAYAQNPDIILGPVFATELQALKKESPAVPVISFTSDSTLMEPNVYTMGVLIPSQIERLVQFMCAQGHKKIAVLGPEDKTGELTMNTLAETVSRCPDMDVPKISLYNPKTVNLAPAVLKIVPKPIDPKKKNLSEEEQILLDTPIQDRLDFDALLLFEDGVRLQQVVSLLSYYDVTPKVVPFYGLANWQSVRDRNLAGGYFAATPTGKVASYSNRYRNAFSDKAPRISSLAYDAVSLVSVLAEHRALTPENLTRESGFNGVDGRFRLRPNGQNERLLEVFQIRPNLKLQSVSPTPDTFLDPDIPFYAPEPEIAPDESELTPQG